MQREVMWSSWDGPGTEHLRLQVDSSGTAADGVVIGVAKGRPFRARYEVRCDPGWRVRSVRVAEAGSKAPPLDLLADGEGRWTTRVGSTVPELGGCGDVDPLLDARNQHPTYSQARARTSGAGRAFARLHPSRKDTGGGGRQLCGVAAIGRENRAKEEVPPAP